MKLNFRQGIVRHQTDIAGNPVFLQRNGNYVDLVVSPDPTVIAFAHRNSNYIVEELKSVQNAWGPFSGQGTKYLFWDVNLSSGALSRSFTTYPPLYTSAPPNLPSIDQHWFDTVENVMRVWNGVKWQEKVRVFAGTVTSNTLVTPEGIGSQAGLTGAAEGGAILLDSFGYALKQSDGTFLTSSTWVSAVNLGTVSTRLDQSVMHGMASEEIPAGSCVSIRPGRSFILARNTDNNTRVSGVVVEDMYEGDVGVLVSVGVLKNPNWAWSNDSFSKPVFCGPTGQVTLTPPTQGVLQQIGFIYDTDAIYVSIQQPILLNDPADTITPPVAPVGVPVAQFRYGLSSTTLSNTSVSGTAPLQVFFENQAVGATQVQWDFTNDGFVDDIGATPVYTYSTPGTYTVRQIAQNQFGTDQEIKTNIITVLAPDTTQQVNLKLSIVAPTQVLGGAVVPVLIKIKNASTMTATNVQGIVKFRTDNGTKVVLQNTQGVTELGPITQLALPSTTLLAGETQSFTANLTLTASASAIQIDGKVSADQADVSPQDNQVAQTILVRP